MEDSGLPLQVVADGPLAGPSTSLPVPTLPHAHGITTNQGDFILAGRDVIVQKHYHGYQPDRVDISAVLGAIRNLRTIHLDILSKATPGTGVWLFKTAKFIIWLDPNGNLKILWGAGIPGAGKTVLVSIVIRELEALAAVEGSRICVCYVYIRYSDRADLSVRNILEILVRQTVERHPDCAAIAEKAYARHLGEGTQPTEAELLEVLHQFKKVNAATFYLLEALDEAPDRIQVDLVLKLASLNVRLFITSRPLEAVQARVPDAHCFPIIAQESDLDLHINQEISRSRDLANLLESADSSLRDEIVSLVKSKCGGMFLHASLQLDALCECTTAHEVRQTLEEFPSNIQHVYLQTWNRVLEHKSNHVLLVKAALVWVLNSSRSMTIEELRRAVAISPETYKFEPNRLAPGTTLIALCQGLVTLEEESKIVRLVHYTAKDALQGLLHDSFPHPNSHLATVCITHLKQCGFQNTTISSKEEFIAVRQADPLLAYASDTWATHARASLDVEDTRQRIASFIRGSHAFPAFTGPDLLYNLDILSPLHMLAVYNLPISSIHPCNISDLNFATRIYQESPLTLASWHDHEAAVASFLAHPGILVNFVNKYGWSALMVAARYGHKSIVKALLAHPGIQINLLNIRGHSALMLAASVGRESIVKILLAHPEIQVNLLDIRRQSALMLAARIGLESIVKILLAHPGIQINLLDIWARSALMLAATRGHGSVVELLLAHPGVQINLLGNGNQSALMLAAKRGCNSIVKLLLAHPEIQINLSDSWGQSALMLAAEMGQESIVRLLLDVPHINTTMKSHVGDTAMWIAQDNRHPGIVQLLQEFQSRCVVELEDGSLDHVTVVDLDPEEEEEDGRRRRKRKRKHRYL
ncbi:hypothetical protein BKA70DRAFT_365526 [Coprinopsis sp. MPI-PUGE-AT-0042]|nr:hypothetical protein BKA70DRAFT_365526 [Coprinopsis sp. MPI-PUGE-AT-0042]